MKRAPNTPQKPAPIRKERTILFAELPPGQVPEALAFLGGLGGLMCTAHSEQRAIDVVYDLHEHSLEALENALEDNGFHLDTSLLSKLMRALYYYAEETELHNLDAPGRLQKQSQYEAYVHAWEQRSHGDRDDTPAVWRKYK